MGSADEAWFSLVLVALFALLSFLRTRFPNASRGSETAVLLIATILFFSIGNFFLGRRHRSLTQSATPVTTHR